MFAQWFGVGASFVQKVRQAVAMNIFSCQMEYLHRLRSPKHWILNLCLDETEFELTLKHTPEAAL